MQTPRSFTAAIEGCVHAANEQIERDIALAWNIGNFWRAAQGKNYPELKDVLARLRPAKTQTADEVAGVFLALKAKGRSVKIRERRRA